MKSWTWTSNVCSKLRKPTVYWAALKAAWPAGWGRWLWTSVLLWRDPPWSPASSSGALSTRKMWTCWSGSRGGPQTWSQGWNTSPMRKGWKSWRCSAWRRVCRHLIVAFQYLMGAYKRDGDTNFLAGPVAIGQRIMVLSKERVDFDWI